MRPWLPSRGAERDCLCDPGESVNSQEQFYAINRSLLGLIVFLIKTSSSVQSRPLPHRSEQLIWTREKSFLVLEGLFVGIRCGTETQIICSCLDAPDFWRIPTAVLRELELPDAAGYLSSPGDKFSALERTYLALDRSGGRLSFDFGS